MLFVWLFALASSIVNACVPQASPSRTAGPVAVQTVQKQASELHCHDVDAAAADPAPTPPVPHVDKTPCSKFCDEPSTGAQAVKQQLDPFGASWLAAMPVSAAITIAVPRVCGAFASERSAWRPAIPIPIAFLRLTL